MNVNEVQLFRMCTCRAFYAESHVKYYREDLMVTAKPFCAAALAYLMYEWIR